METLVLKIFMMRLFLRYWNGRNMNGSEFEWGIRIKISCLLKMQELDL